MQTPPLARQSLCSKTLHRLIPTLIILAFIPCTASFAGSGIILRVGHPVSGKYIVTLSPLAEGEVPQVAADLAKQYGGEVTMTYDSALRGFVILANESQATALSHSPRVLSIEEDGIGSVATTQVIPSSPPVSGKPATLWGLDRIDQASPTSARLDQAYSYCSTGQPVRIYIVDTGVEASHPEFGGRVDPAPSLTTWLSNRGVHLGNSCWVDNVYTPAAAHGTGVASVAAGATLGVAKNATIVDARAIKCTGGADASTVLAVLDWIATGDTNWAGEPRVVNCSFEFLWQPSITSAVDNLVTQYGITVTVAAGNDNDSTAWYSPAGNSYGITAGALNKANDSRWQYSNYGVDFYAPGQFVESAGFTQIGYYRSELPNCYSTAYPQDGCTSGTSFAAPFAAGVAARYLQSHWTATPAAVLSYLSSQSSQHVNIAVPDPTSTTKPILNMTDCN